MKARGIDVINLSLGEPDFNTPEFIKDAATQAIADNFSHYMPVPGYLDLREAISLKLKRDNKLDYPPTQIVVSTGAKQSLANVIMCLVNPGDEVLLPAPYWVSYSEIIKLSGGVPVVIPTDISSDFKVPASRIEQHITDKTKAMVFSSPCNPSGSVYSSGELKSIADIMGKHEDIIIISDEIYEFINYTGKHHSIGQFDNMKERVVIVNGVSKAFAMTGWRIGYMAGPKWISDACIKIQGQFTSGTCGIAQKAAKSAMLGDNSEVYKMRDIFLQRRDLVLDMLKEIPGIITNTPQGAFYVFPDISSYFGKSFNNNEIKGSYDLCMFLLNDAHVALVSGEAFGNDNCIRISYAASNEELIDAIGRIKKSLEKLN